MNFFMKVLNWAWSVFEDLSYSIITLTLSTFFSSDGQSSCADDAVKFTGIINHSKICDAKCLQTAVKGIINARRGEGCSPFEKCKKEFLSMGQNNTLCLVVYSSYEVQV